MGLSIKFMSRQKDDNITKINEYIEKEKEIKEREKKQKSLIEQRLQKKWDRKKRREEFKRTITMVKLLLLNRDIDPNDTRTIQAHKNAQGEFIDYYVSNPYLDEGSAFRSVIIDEEDFKNRKFIYEGVVEGADNAIGVLQTNVPLSEIVANVKGNRILSKMLSQDYAKAVRDDYYNKIGESTIPLEDHLTHFANLIFPLGRILKSKNGECVCTRLVTKDIESALENTRRDGEILKALRDKETKIIDIGNASVVAQSNCWLTGNGAQFAGINKEALPYEFTPKGEVIKTSDKKYVYIGKIKLGRTKPYNPREVSSIQFAKPFFYQDAVLWMDGMPIIQYFIDKKLQRLVPEMGEIFTHINLETKLNMSNIIFAGGITIDKEGMCQANINEVPETVRKAVEEYFAKNKNKPEIIKINDTGRE